MTVAKLNPKKFPTTPEIDANLIKLANVLTRIEAKLGKPLIITSGLRSLEHQMKVNPKAPKSKHLLGLAADLSDPKGDLWKWFMINMNLMVDLGCYFEDKSATPTWVHLQIVPPKSGKRIFLP